MLNRRDSQDIFPQGEYDDGLGVFDQQSEDQIASLAEVSRHQLANWNGDPQKKDPLDLQILTNRKLLVVWMEIAAVVSYVIYRCNKG